jgi:hypothetical protein
MHLLNTGLITAQFPTQIIAASFGARVDEQTPPSLSAYVAVEIDGCQHLCEVQPTSVIDTSSEYGKKLFDEWSELLDNKELVHRTVTLTAQPSSDVLGTAHFTITQIDLRVEDGESRFFANVVS